MRSRLLATTAVLLATIAIAAAQSNPQGGASQSPTSPGASGGARGQEGGAGQAQDHGQGQDKGRSQQGVQGRDEQRGQREQSTGQNERGQAQGQRQRENEGETQRGQDRAEPKGGQRDPQRQQGQREQRDQQQQGQREQRDQQQRGQREPDQQQQGQREQGRDQQRGEREGQRDQGGQAGTASLTTEQRTRIRETVITRGPKVTNVNFTVRVGTVVPRTVHLVEVPTVLVEVYPQYRGRKYFVYQDEIIIVDDDMRIVAVLTV
jgi:Protein of unknown function (DUF1236)